MRAPALPAVALPLLLATQPASAVDAVSPEYVIFSAGHDHSHPSKAAVERYQNAGVKKRSLFRTDRGDDEPGPYEYKDRATRQNCKDKPGDDDVEVIIDAAGGVDLAYRSNRGSC